MNTIIQHLGLSSAINFEELSNCLICNLDKDKILIICNIESLKEIDVVVNRLPGLRKKLMGKINNENNKELVQDEKIPMSKFLWDMYVIGLHYVDEPDKAFKASSISEYERDRFIARKIIIQYKHLDELRGKFDQLIFPERILNAFPTFDVDDDANPINYEKVRELIKNIDIVIKEEE
ncbi:hypothetical protein OCA20_14250 [Bacillus cereus]|nr:hypothetical protein [Bacillus cereus]